MKFSKIALSTLSAAAFGFLALGLASTSAFAATQTTTMAVTANVGNTCPTLSVTPMAFGTVTTAADNLATATITVNCSSNDVYSIYLSAGDSGSDSARAMNGVTTSTNHLGYALYSDAAHSVNWGATTGAPTFVAGSGTNQTYIVYGRVTMGQVTAAQANPQNYADSITVTLNY